MGIEATLGSPLAEAVRKVGSQSAYGRLVGRSQTWVFQCLSEGKPVQAEHVFKVEAATGISRHDLRPDLYPLEHSPRAPAVQPAATASRDGFGNMEPAR